MSMIAREEGVKAMFFLQPVPAIGKTLTDAENQVNPDLRYGERYRKVVSTLQELRQHGIAVFDILDVFAEEPLPATHPFWRHPRVTVLPHVAAYSDARSGAALVAANVARFRAGEPVEHVVDWGTGY